MNLTLLVVTESTGLVRVVPQLKLAPSADELTPYTERSLVRGQELFILKGVDFSLAAITCSDFFSRSLQAEKRYLDFLEYSHVRTTTPGDALDILVNHQYNRSPDHQYFAEGLGRLYGDRDFAKRLVVLVANAMDEQSNFPGSSRALFHRSVPLRRTDAMREASMPVTGYELLGGPGSLFINLETPPKYWSDEDAPVMCHADGAVHPVDRFVRTLVPPVSRAPIKFSSHRELIRRLSELGDYDGAERHAREALKYLDMPWRDLPSDVVKDRELQRVQLHLTIAQQHRNRGQYQACLDELAHAESLLGNVPLAARKMAHGIEEQRIRFNRIFADTLQGQGRCGVALAQLEALASDIEDAVASASDPDTRALKNQAVNARRQCGDLFLLTGDYRRSLETHRSTDYDWYQVRELAYSRRGEADALRMLGDFDQAMTLYAELIKYCDLNADARLWSRAMVGWIECNRARWLITAEPGEGPPASIEANLDALARTSAETSFRVGTIYVQLVEASLLTRRDPDRALALLEDLRRQCNGSPHVDRLALEAFHVEFGIAEALRAGHRVDKASEAYSRCLQQYERSGMRWGVLRCELGVRLLDGAKVATAVDLDGYLDACVLARGCLDEHTFLLANIPLVP